MTSRWRAIGIGRRWLVLPAALAVALAVLAGAASRSLGAGPSEADRLRAIERARLADLVDADTAAAGRRMAGDFALVNPAGEMQSKQEYLAAVRSGDVDYRVLEPSGAIRVRVHGDVAVLRYPARFDIVLSGAVRLAHGGINMSYYERRQGRWKLVWQQTTAIPNDPDAFVDSLRPT